MGLQTHSCKEECSKLLGVVGLPGRAIGQAQMAGPQRGCLPVLRVAIDHRDVSPLEAGDAVQFLVHAEAVAPVGVLTRAAQAEIQRDRRPQCGVIDGPDAFLEKNRFRGSGRVACPVAP